MTNSNFDPITGRANAGNERESIELGADQSAATGSDYDPQSSTPDFGPRNTLGDGDGPAADTPRYSAGEGFAPGGGAPAELEDSYADESLSRPYGQAAGYAAEQPNGSGGAQDKVKQVAGQVGDQAGQVKDTVGEQASAVKDSVTDKAAQVKDVAAQRAGDVAGVTKDELSKLVSEARGQVQTLWDQAAGQLREQAGTGQRQLAEIVHGLASELGELASKAESQGPITSLLKQAAHQSGQFSHWLSEAHTDDVLTEVRRFARRRPAVFLAGATLAGIVAGRLGRGLMAAAKTDQRNASANDGDGFYAGSSITGAPAGYRVAGATSTTPGALGTPPGSYTDISDFDNELASGRDRGLSDEFGDDLVVRPGFAGGERR